MLGGLAGIVLAPAGRVAVGGVPDEDPAERARPDGEQAPRRPPSRCRATSAAGRSPPRPTGAACPSRRRHGTAAAPPAGLLWFVLALLAINWISLLFFQPSTGEPRVTVPFSPYFLEQVKGGQVDSISSKGNTVEGNFKVKLRYPAEDSKATPTKLFATEVPSFWNGSQLSSLLEEKGVEINAESTTATSSRCWPSSCSDSARRC